MHKKSQLTTITIILLGVLTLLLYITPNSEAREPAVDPVAGLSIDAMSEIPAGTSPGFDFTAGRPTVVTANSATIPVEPAPLLMALFILSLPLAMWLGLSSGIKLGAEKHPENVIHLDSVKKTEDKFKKAS